MLIALSAVTLRSRRVAAAVPEGIDALSIGFDTATPEQINLYCPTTRTLDSASTVAVRYRAQGSGTWMTAHPLYRITSAWMEAGSPQAVPDAFAGCIFDLAPGTTYEIELTLTEPGQPTRTSQTTRATRALPPAAGTPNKTATTANDLNTVFSTLNPGDVLELQNGTYNVSGLFLNRSGTVGSPIYIRGQSRGGVILSNSSRVLQLWGISNVVFENMTMQGSGSDSGTAASSRGIEFWNGAPGQTNITFRDIDMSGVDVGIKGFDEVHGCLVYNCVFQGNNAWTEANVGAVAGSTPNLTWNDDGICLPGSGNCAFENTMSGFGDTFAHTVGGVFSAATHYYRNKVLHTGDDSCEGDYSTRNCSYYDNYITNCSTLFSADPVYGGPMYVFRNVALNTVRGPWKLNAQNTGLLLYSNTIVRTNGQNNTGWMQFNNGAIRGWSYRNNVLIYRGGGVPFTFESPVDNLDFTHNAWFPNGTINWSNSGGSFASIAAALAGLPDRTPLFGGIVDRHSGDVITVNDPFSSAITLGSDHLTQVSISTVPSIAGGQTPKNSGVAIPGITDGYTGAAPDMGAAIEGRSTPTWGATR